MEMNEGWEAFAEVFREYDHLLIAKSMIEDGSASLEKIAQWLELPFSKVEALQKECEAEAAEAENHSMQTEGQTNS